MPFCIPKAPTDYVATQIVLKARNMCTYILLGVALPAAPSQQPGGGSFCALVAVCVWSVDLRGTLVGTMPRMPPARLPSLPWVSLVINHRGELFVALAWMF